MIVFFDKDTGKITGTIDGRIHTEDHLKMWAGDKKQNKRLVVNWKPVKWYDKGGNPTEREEDRWTADFAPDIEGEDQKEIIFKLDQNLASIKDYKVNPLTNKLESAI